MTSFTTFLANFVKDVIEGNDDDKAIRAIFDVLDPFVEERNNGQLLNRSGFARTIMGLRSSIKNRRLVDSEETFVVATPEDPEGKSGSAAHHFVFTGNQEGVGDVKVTIVSAVNVEWVEGGHAESEGKRKIVSESFILRTEMA